VLIEYNKDTFAVSEGLYARYMFKNVFQWHRKVAEHLGKDREEIIPLDYDGAEKWGDR